MSHTIPSGTPADLQTLARDMSAHNMHPAAALISKAAQEILRLEQEIRELMKEKMQLSLELEAQTRKVGYGG